MKTRASDPSFPADLAVLVFPGPMALLSMALLWVTCDRGTPWMVAYTGAVFTVIAGAVKLFRAKLPLYRQGRYFKFGPQGLPAATMPLYWSAMKLILAGMAVAAFLLMGRLSVPIHW